MCQGRIGRLLKRLGESLGSKNKDERLQYSADARFIISKVSGCPETRWLYDPMGKVLGHKYRPDQFFVKPVPAPMT